MDTSKLPSFDEISHMAGKFLGDVKTSVQQIYEEYKVKHPEGTCETKACSKEDTKEKKESKSKE